MPDPKQDPSILEANRRSWNAATAAHNTHKADQAAFFRAGGGTLFPEEIELLGDIAGKRLVHLQCNAGQDTLSLARRGAEVTGVDLSDEAIEFATRLSADAGIPATFHRKDVYDWLAEAGARGERYDIVFCSYGAICWLSDLDAWAKGIAGILAPGGRVVAVDFHPVAMLFNERWELDGAYFGGGPLIKWDDGVGDYVGMSGAALAPSGFKQGVRDFVNPSPVYEFQWHLGAIFEALLGAGLRIDQFHEYPYSNGARLFVNMREEPGRRMYPPKHLPDIPLMYGLVAAKAR